MNWLELQKKSAELLAQARKLQDELTAHSPDLDAEAIEQKAAQIEAMVAESKELAAKAERLEALETTFQDATADLDDRTRPVAQPDDPEAFDHQTARRRVPAQARDREEEDRRGFRNLGEFALSVYQASPAAGGYHRVDPRLTSLYDENVGQPSAASGLSQTVGSEGGWLVPPAFSQRVWDGLRDEPDNLLNRTDQFPIDGESITLLANAETSRVTGSRYGGVQGYWLEEAEQIVSSKPKVRRVRLEPHQVGALVYVTDKLLQNGGSAVSAWLERACREELGWLIGDAIVNGNGAGKPQGILTSGALVTVAKESGQAADTFNQENVAKMWGRMHARSRRNAVWLINQDVDPQLDLMVSNVKNVAGTENVGGFVSGLYNAERDTLKGRPIIRTEFNKTLGDVGDVILADLSAYATAYHRAGVSSAMSMHLRFDYAETAFRFMADIDGQTWLASAITPANGTNTLSPFVTLAARA